MGHWGWKIPPAQERAGDEPGAAGGIFRRAGKGISHHLHGGPLAEEDFAGFAILGEMTDIQIVGDDLFVTNVERISKGIEENIANAILIKPNQIGTITEAKNAIELGRAPWLCLHCVPPFRRYGGCVYRGSGCGHGAGQIKTGAPCRGERTAKYNRLLQIEDRAGKASLSIWGAKV